MLTTIKGVYDHGIITLTEDPLVKSKANVIVTFLTSEEEIAHKGKQKIILGLLDGMIKLPDDFNEPLDDLKDYL